MGDMMRTPELIAAEINVIKAQARDVMCRSAIEIGRRLYEAKAVVPHGKWGEWLENNVDYSERTAQNLMRMYDEYGKNGNPQAIAGLSLTQAVVLLGLDRETRAQLLESGGVEGMSTRELETEVRRLNKEIEQRQVTIDQLIARDTNAEELQRAQADLQNAEAKAEEHAAAADRMRIERDDARAEADKARQQARDAVTRAGDASAENVRLRAELEAERSKPAPLPEVLRVEVIPPEVEAELEALRKRAKTSASEAVVRLRALYAQTTEELKRLEALITELHATEPDEARRYAAAVSKGMRMLAEQLEVRFGNT